LNTCQNAEGARCDIVLRAKADAATREFTDALRDLEGPGNPAERERLHVAAVNLMRVLARVLLQLE
jgi:hypothetical protein